MNFLSEIGAWREMQEAGYFDNHKGYEGFPLFAVPERTRLSELVGLNSEDDVLEIGCGYGRLLYGVALLVRSAVGIDLHEAPLEKGRELFRDLGNVTFKLCDGQSIPFDDESFSIVYAFSVMQHISRGLVRRYFEEAARVLRPGGALLFQTYLRDPSIRRKQASELNPNVRTEQSVAWTQEEFEAAASGLGLQTRTITNELHLRLIGKKAT